MNMQEIFINREEFTFLQRVSCQPITLLTTNKGAPAGKNSEHTTKGQSKIINKIKEDLHISNKESVYSKNEHLVKLKNQWRPCRKSVNKISSLSTSVIEPGLARPGNWLTSHQTGIGHLLGPFCLWTGLTHQKTDELTNRWPIWPGFLFFSFFKMPKTVHFDD